MQNFNSSGSTSFKYQSEDEVPQESIQKYISERNKLKSPESGYIDPAKDTELRDAMMQGWFDPATAPTAEISTATSPALNKQTIEQPTSEFDFTGLYDDIEQPTSEFDFSGLFDDAIEPVKQSYWGEIGEALSQGYTDMESGTQATGFLMGLVDRETIAKNIVDNEKARKKVPLYVTQFNERIQQEGRDVSNAEGFIDTTVEVFDLIGETFLEAVKNPDATFYTVAQSAAMSLPSVAGGAAGFISPIPGGLAIGTGIGTFSVEAGAYLNGEIIKEMQKQGRDIKDLTQNDVLKVLDSPAFIDGAKTRAVKAGLSVAVVEALFAGVAGKIIARGPAKAAELGIEQAKKSQFARGGAAFALETAGEPAGVIAQQLATGEELNFGDAALEGISGLAQSAGTVATVQALSTAKSQIANATPGARRPAVDDLDKVFGEGVDDVPVDLLSEELSKPDSIMEPQIPESQPETQDQLDYKAEVQGAQDIIDQYPDLQDMAGSIDESTLINSNIPQEMFLVASEIPANQRTPGQQALVAYGRKLSKPGMSDTEEIAQGISDPIPQDPDMPSDYDQEQADMQRYEATIALDPVLLGNADREFIADFEAENEVTPEMAQNDFDNKPIAARTPKEILANEDRQTMANEVAAEAEVTANATDEVTAPITNETVSNVVPELEGQRALASVSGSVKSGKLNTGTVQEETADIAQAMNNRLNNDLSEPISFDEAVVELGYDVESPAFKAYKNKLDTSQAEQATAEAESIESIEVATSESVAKPTIDENKAALAELKAQKPKGIKAKRDQLIAIADKTTEIKEAVILDIDTKANESALSPTNDKPEPTDAQKESGDYDKGLLTIDGMGIAIENPRGSTRKGKDTDGKEWATTMKDHYGEIQNTRGADGDNVDVFIGDDPTSDAVFIVDQIDPTTGKFDEHKVVLGANSLKQATMFYGRNYDKDWKGAGAVTEMTKDEFKTWLSDGDNKVPVSDTIATTPAVTESSASSDINPAAVTPPAAPVKLAPLPGTVSIGPGSFEPKPLGGTLFRETNAEGISDLLRGVLSNNSYRGDTSKLFVSDNKDLAIGQGANKGVMIEMDGSLVSGSENKKPGTGIVEGGGKEYKTDFIGRDAITRFTIPSGFKLKGPARVFANEQFSKVKNEDGSITFTRKDLPTPAPVAAPKKPTMAENKAAKDAAKAAQPTDDKRTAARKKSLAVNDTDSLATAVAKRGGLDKAAWIREGADPASAKRGGNSVPVPIGKPLFRAKGGMTADSVAELANELGYGNDIDANAAVSMIIGELNGTPSYTPAGTESQMAAAMDDQEAAQAQADDFDLQSEQDGTATPPATPEPATPTMNDVESPEEFGLTGSDRASDANRNQSDMFSPGAMNEPVFDDDDDGYAFGFPNDSIEGTSDNKEPLSEVTEPTTPTLAPESSPIAKLVKDGDPLAVVQNLEARLAGTVLGEIVTRIKDLIPQGLRFETISISDVDPTPTGNFKRSVGIFWPSQNKIILRDETWTENGLDDETIIHEVLHAVTRDLLQTGNLAVNKDTELGRATANVYDLANTIISALKKRLADGTLVMDSNLLDIATENIDEIISWGLTNEKFQQILKDTHVDYQTVWSKFVSALANLMGINQNDMTAFEALMSATDQVLNADFRANPESRNELVKIVESSFVNSKPDLPSQQRIVELREQNSIDEELRDNRLDIAAGKRIKDTNAEIDVLEQQIETRRANDPHFKPGEEDIDKLAEEKLAKSKQYMTLMDRMKDALDDKLNWWENVPNTIGRIASGAFYVEQSERNMYDGRKSAEDSMTAFIHKAANAKVAASMVIDQFGAKLVNGTLTSNRETPGLRQILEEVSKNGTRFLRRFELYLVVNRSKELIDQGRENFITQEEIDTVDSWMERNPNTKALFEKQQKALAKWNESNLQIAIDAGWINAQDAFGGFKFVTDEGKELLGPDSTFFKTEAEAQSVADQLGAKGTTEQVDGWFNDAYVPFYRVSDDGVTTKSPKSKGKIGEVGKATKKLKGGIGAIPVLDNLVKNAEFLVNGSMRTLAMQKVEESFTDTAMEEATAAELQGLDIAKLLDPAVMRQEYKEMQEQAEADGEPLADMTDAELKRWTSFKQFARPTSQNVAVVYRNGRAKYYKVLEPKLLDAIKSIGPYKASALLKVVGMPTRLLQKSITIMPAFLVRSFAREVQNAFIVNKEGGYNPIKTLGVALKNFGKIAVGDNVWMEEMMVSGHVNYNTYTNTAPDNIRAQLEKAGVKKGSFKNIVQGQFLGLRPMLRLYKQIAIASEHANRRSVYDSVLKAGGTKEEAMYQALDIMNFSRRSDLQAMEVLNAVVPFLNPRIQGIDRLFRGYKEDRKTFALKAGMMTVAATSLALWNWEENEEEMGKLKDEDKAMNYHFFIDTGSGVKQHWRIPKGFEVGQITGTLPEFFVEQLYGKTPEPTLKALRRFMTTTFGLQTPQFIAPIKDVGFNEDSFRQRPIINFGQQFLLPPQQFDQWTSKLVVDIAQSQPDWMPTWFRSPKQLEYLIKGYTGSAGALVLEGIDDIYRATGNAPDLPTKKLSERYLIRDYLRTGSSSSTKQTDIFYDMLTDVGKLSSTLKSAKDSDRAQYRELKATNREKLAARKSLNRIGNQMTKISNRINRVLESDSSRDFKEAEKDRLVKQRNEMAQRAVDKYFYIFD